MNKILGLLGLSRRASKTVHGFDAVSQAIKRKQVKLLFLATDASENTREAILRQSGNIQTISMFSSVELSQAIGTKRIVVIGLTDRGLAESILSKLSDKEKK